MGITQQLGASSLIKPGVIDNTASRPASPYEGQVIFQKDTDQLLVWNGTAWVIPNSPAQDPAGMALITPTSVTNGTLSGNVASITSGSSSVSINGCFTADYRNYKVIITGLSHTTTPGIRVKFNASTGSTYSSVLTYFSYAGSTSVNSNESNTSTGLQLCFSSSNNNTTEFEIFAPFVVSTTSMRGSGIRSDNPQITLGYDSNSASQTGFSLVPDNGTFTSGEIRIYGYR
jgi:hypothetical protein